MKRFSKLLIPFCFLIVFFIFIPSIVQADPGGGGCDPLDPGCPIDGGLAVLLAVGAGYGIKKVMNAHKSGI